MARRKKFERERDLVRISDLYVRGVTQAAIAEEIGYTQQTVSNDIKEIQRRWLSHTTRNLDEAKAEELAKIDRLELEYWERYAASRDNRVETFTDGKGIKRTVVIPRNKRHPFGNKDDLEGVRKCILNRIALLGLEAAKVLDIDGDIKILVEYVDKNNSN